MMRASAGILSPASTSTMSPGTISWAAMRWRSPSRTTVDFGRRERHQRPHRALGARLLEEAEQGVEDDDRQDDDGLVGQGGLARILQQPFDHRDDGGDEQDDHQEVLELLEQPPPPGRFRRALQPVRPVLLEAPLRLGAAQAACRRRSRAPRRRLRPVRGAASSAVPVAGAISPAGRPSSCVCRRARVAVCGTADPTRCEVAEKVRSAGRIALPAGVRAEHRRFPGSRISMQAQSRA